MCILHSYDVQITFQSQTLLNIENVPDLDQHLTSLYLQAPARFRWFHRTGLHLFFLSENACLICFGWSNRTEKLVILIIALTCDKVDANMYTGKSKKPRLQMRSLRQSVFNWEIITSFSLN